MNYSKFSAARQQAGFLFVSLSLNLADCPLGRLTLEVFPMLVSYKHRVVNSNLHLQFTPKYRGNVFYDEVVKSAYRIVFQDVAED